jgi:hypothetical protein
MGMVRTFQMCSNECIDYAGAAFLAPILSSSMQSLVAGKRDLFSSDHRIKKMILAVIAYLALAIQLLNDERGRFEEWGQVNSWRHIL